MEQRCRSGQACVAITTDGPAVTYKPLCQRCVDHVQALLDRLPEILNILPAWKGGLRGEIGEAKVSASKFDAPCPLNCHVVDLIDEIRAVLQRVNGVRVNDLITQSDGTIWANEIRRVFKSADKTLGLSRHWARRLTPCPDCGQRTLGSFSGEDLVRCSACHLCIDLDTYQKVTLLRVGIEKKERI